MGGKHTFKMDGELEVGALGWWTWLDWVRANGTAFPPHPTVYTHTHHALLYVGLHTHPPCTASRLVIVTAWVPADRGRLQEWALSGEGEPRNGSALAIKLGAWCPSLPTPSYTFPRPT